jgi:1-deoxy-D-xylulose-5-phosphate reductoisomerase
LSAQPGLLPTLAAAKAGKRVLLANKEALVMAGPLFMAAVREQGAELLPIDSEHNAIFQCLPPVFDGEGLAAVGRASDSADRFRWAVSGYAARSIAGCDPGSGLRASQLEHGPQDFGRFRYDDEQGAGSHRSALAVRCLPDQIEVVIHPQSVIHSMVEYQDGSVLAQLGHPDMRTPIAHALAWPRRLTSGVAFLDFTK